MQNEVSNSAAFCHRKLGSTDYDVCVAGGTLGVFLALALQVLRTS